MTRPLLVLAIVIAITESLIMFFLQSTHLNVVNHWLTALVDALAVSFVAILTVKFMLNFSWITIRDSGGSQFIQLKIGAIVFGFEALVMLALEVFYLPLSNWQETLFDTSILTVGSSVAIYGLVLQPATGHELHDRQKLRFDTTIASSFLGYACLMTLLLMILISTYEQQLQEREAEIYKHEANQLELIKNSFLNELNHTTLDLLILAGQADLQELLTDNQHSLAELQADYMNLGFIKPYYDQIRYINEKGFEIIRVHHKDGKPVITINDKLQNKQSRNYFQQGIKLVPGEIYISPLDLNVKKNRVETPYKPIIRLVTPVVDSQKINRGAIVINLKGQQLLNSIQQAEATAIGKLMLLNSQSYWLYNDEPDSLWGFMFEDRKQLNFRNKYPEAWKTLETMETGLLNTIHGSFMLQNIEFNPDNIIPITVNRPDTVNHIHWPYWKLISYIEPGYVSNQMKDTRLLMSILYIVILIMAAVGTTLLTRAMIERKNAEKQILQLAFYDSLTGLANRRLFMEKLALEISHARRNKDKLALMYLDLDHFKPINDELGHDAGDAALQEVAERLRKAVRDSDTISRQGGDEFAIILPKPGDNKMIKVIAQRIIDSFKQAIHPKGHTRYLGISIGIVVLLDDELPETLIKRADSSMYEAKKAGRNCYRIYTDETVTTS